MQTQADSLDIYRPITDAATETLKVALRNMERFNEQQLQWVRVALEQSDRLTSRLAQVRSIDDLFLAQSQFAVSQMTQGIEVWWRLFHAMLDSQPAAMSPGTEKRGTAWRGVERRKASVVPFPGPERRKVA